jgi:hypothetical protein
MTTPTPATASAATPSSSGSSGSSSSPLFTMAIEVVGVIILTIVAGIGAKTGKIVAVFMAGLVVLWLVTHAAVLKKLIPGQNVSVQG